MTDTTCELEKAKMNLETSLISWLDLQRFFAAGLAIAVDSELDLVEVGYAFASDNQAQVANWLQARQVAPVSDQQAVCWFEQQAEVWALVVKPWVLVQLPDQRA